MNNQTFNRYEEKFIITDKQKDILINYLLDFCYFDKYSGMNRTYQIFNIYYDTVGFDVIRNSIGKPEYKEKLRLRSYKYPIDENGYIFLEIKKKVFGQINKRRINIKYKDAMAFIENNKKPDVEDYVSRQVIEEISYFLERNKVYPKYFISYQRIALYTKENINIRITFDKDIVARPFKEQKETNLLEKDQWLMEIKTITNFPLWLTSKLSELGLYGRSFSKYGTAFKIKTTGEEKYDL